MSTTTYKTTRLTTVTANHAPASPPAMMEIIGDGPTVLVDGYMPRPLAVAIEALIRAASPATAKRPVGRPRKSI